MAARANQIDGELGAGGRLGSFIPRLPRVAMGQPKSRLVMTSPPDQESAKRQRNNPRNRFPESRSGRGPFTRLESGRRVPVNHKARRE